MSDMRLAIIFPGMGYHKDKPLLYYSRKLLEQMGYDVIEVEYGEHFTDRQAAYEKMKSVVIPIVNKISWEDYKDAVFVSKSVGTQAAGEITKGLPVPIRNIYFTPVEEALPYLNKESIVFAGESDPMMDLLKLREICDKEEAILYTYHEANHSLETPDVMENLEILGEVLAITEKFIKTL